jgi:starch phosphorylase
VPDLRFEEVKEYVRSGVFGTSNYDELMGSLEGNEGYGRADYFLVGKDFPSYIECQEKVDEAYRDQKVSCLKVAQCLCKLPPSQFKNIIMRTSLYVMVSILIFHYR